jgi:hypothetical protein
MRTFELLPDYGFARLVLVMLGADGLLLLRTGIAIP